MCRKKILKLHNPFFSLYLSMLWRDFVPNTGLDPCAQVRQLLSLQGVAQEPVGLCKPLPLQSHMELQECFPESLKPTSRQRGNFPFPWALWALDLKGSTCLLKPKMRYSSISAVSSFSKLFCTNTERAQNECWVMMTLINDWVFC